MARFWLIKDSMNLLSLFIIFITVVQGTGEERESYISIISPSMKYIDGLLTYEGIDKEIINISVVVHDRLPLDTDTKYRIRDVKILGPGKLPLDDVEMVRCTADPCYLSFEQEVNDVTAHTYTAVAHDTYSHVVSELEFNTETRAELIPLEWDCNICFVKDKEYLIVDAKVKGYPSADSYQLEDGNRRVINKSVDSAHFEVSLSSLADIDELYIVATNRLETVEKNISREHWTDDTPRSIVVGTAVGVVVVLAAIIAVIIIVTVKKCPWKKKGKCFGTPSSSSASPPECDTGRTESEQQEEEKLSLTENQDGGNRTREEAKRQARGDVQAHSLNQVVPAAQNININLQLNMNNGLMAQQTSDSIIPNFHAPPHPTSVSDDNVSTHQTSADSDVEMDAGPPSIPRMDMLKGHSESQEFSLPTHESRSASKSRSARGRTESGRRSATSDDLEIDGTPHLRFGTQVSEPDSPTTTHPPGNRCRENTIKTPQEDTEGKP